MRAYWLALFLAGCGGGSGGSGGTGTPAEVPPPSSAFYYSGPTQSELDEVRAAWSARDLSSRGVELVLNDADESDYDVQIYRHTVGTSSHYGVVTVPKSSDGSMFPVVVSADGLNQSNPTINAETVIGYFNDVASRSVVVIPTFRGRTLIYEGRSFPSDGDFCDAYDGAVDDTIALLNVVEEVVVQADLGRVLIRGGSRGGNTALLMGVRDDRVTVVDATAAPVDFYREEVRIRYGSQYSCQFFTNKTSDESRLKMLASSPLHFDVLPSVEHIYLHHGRVDSIVPLWNAEEMNARLLAQDANVQYWDYADAGHLEIYGLADYQARRAQTMEAFLAGE